MNLRASNFDPELEKMENNAFDKAEETSDSENSILPNAVADSETDSARAPRRSRVKKDKVASVSQSAYTEESFIRANQRRTSFELDVFRNLDKIDIFTSKAGFIDERGEQYKITKNFEDLYYIIVKEKGGKVMDNFLRNLFQWTLSGDCVDVKDTFGLTLARILQNSDLSFRYVNDA